MECVNWNQKLHRKGDGELFSWGKEIKEKDSVIQDLFGGYNQPQLMSVMSS